MSVSINLPQITALKKAIEQVTGIKPNTHNSFIEMSCFIDNYCKEHISESTLERIWAYSTRAADMVSLRSIDVLARVAGAKDWEDWCLKLKNSSAIESEEIFYGEHIDSSSLLPGAALRLGWLPDRIVKVRFLGGTRFEVLESQNSSLRPGDSFDCLTFQKGREVYLDHFVRKGAKTASRYVAGQKSGLTLLEIL